MTDPIRETALAGIDAAAQADDLLKPMDKRVREVVRQFQDSEHLMCRPTYNPDTHVAVPREPTEVMNTPLMAFYQAWKAAPVRRDMGLSALREGYRALIRAAEGAE